MAMPLDRTVCEHFADALEAGGRGYAGFAASLFLERHPDLSGPWGGAGAVPLTRWRDQFERMIIDAASAIRFARPELLASAMIWQRDAFAARGFDPGILVAGWGVLHEVLSAHLPAAQVQPCDHFFSYAVKALESHAPAGDVELRPDTATARESLLLLQNLLEGNRRAAIDRVLNAVDQGMLLRTAYMEVVVPALREVGRMWHVGELTIAEEHLCTEAIRSLLAVLAYRAPAATPNGWTAVTAAVSGNGHDLAVRIVSDFLEADGFRPICLGADVPDDEVVQAIRFFDAHVLVLSATLLGHLRSIRRTIELVRSETNPQLRIIVGGGAFASAADLWRDLGADGWAAEADEAPALARRVLTDGSDR